MFYAAQKKSLSWVHGAPVEINLWLPLG